MASVTQEIKRLLRQKDRKIVDGAAAVRGLLTEVKRQIVEELRSVDSESYTAFHLKQNLASIERHLADFETAATGKLGGLIDDAWEAGADLLPTATQGSGLFFAFGHIPETLLQVMKEFTFQKISGLSSAAFDKVRGELSLGLLGQKTPWEVTQAIAGTLKKPGIFKSLEARAETITKVEMGRAYSAATNESIKQAAATVPELMKQWWHAGHPKQPRENHLKLDGQTQPADQPFVIGSLMIDYPRDPKAPAQEVINCGCELAPWHPAWGKARGRTRA